MKKPSPSTIYQQIIRNNRILVFINISVLVLLFLAIQNNNKPPLVIRYLPNGQAQIINDYQNINELTQYDIEVFLKTFISRWDLESSFAIQDNMPKALNLMDSDLRRHKMGRINSTIIDEIVKKNQKTITTIEKIKFKNSGDKIDAQVRYRRQIISFDNKPLKTIVRRVELILSPLAQRSSQYPYGVVVEAFEEFALN